MDTKKIFSRAPVGHPDLSSVFSDDGAQRRGYSKERTVIAIS